MPWSVSVREGQVLRRTSTISTRRFRDRPLSPELEASGRCAATPAAVSLRALTWWRMKKRTTCVARAVDSSQFEGKRAVAIGRTSVWPSTRSTQGISAGIFFSKLGQRR